ncbi:MAG TPA: AI-2E family transporter [Verrucomicrobiae bacterium]|jgi:predicted PurR-regulated permease PerM|nr:AI-2E family transporter [Verrucomicrobiae bacterium]
MKAITTPKTTTSSQLTTVLSYGAILLLGYFVFLIVEPFLVPLAWSAVLAIFFYPLHEKVLRKMKPSAAAAMSTLAVTLLLIVPALVVLVYTAREALDATARLQSQLIVHGQGPNEGLVMHVEEWVRSRLPQSWQAIDMSDPVQQAAEKIASFLGARFTGLLKNLVSFFVDLFIMIFALFFMFRDGEDIVHGAKHLLPFDEDIQTDMLEESKELIFASVAVGLLVAAIQGLLGGMSFAITGISSPIFWGALIAFFSLVPVVGSALIWGPAALWLGFTGHWGRALLVVVICGGVSTVADNIVRPMLLRNRTRLNELLLFIGVLGGLEAFGLLGLVAGPTIVAAAMGVFRVYMEHRDELSAKGA